MLTTIGYIGNDNVIKKKKKIQEHKGHSLNSLIDVWLGFNYYSAA